MRHLRLFLLCLTVLCITGNARADDRAKARDAYREGARRFDVGDYRNALDAFKQAYLLYEDPAFLFNMAQCYRLLNDRENALRTYRVYLNRVPKAPNREEIERIIEGLAQTLEKERATASLPPNGSQEPRAEPPAPAVQPSAPVVQPSAPVLVVTHNPPERTPGYKKWWVWTAVGVVAVGVALGVGLGVGLAAPNAPHVTTTDGTVRPF